MQVEVSNSKYKEINPQARKTIPKSEVSYF